MSLATPAVAGDFLLSQPIACTLGQDCYIQQLTDHDPGPGARDFNCGPQTYDGHKGTDFALPSLAAEQAGVDVLAAADGTVRGVRNDMPDVLQGTPGAPDVTDRECGNGVVIAHRDGWETQYCHMAQGSVTVRTGQTVTAGTVLGRVGLSGQTQFPHVHLSVRHNGQVVDPFSPDNVNTCGDGTGPDLWQTPVAVDPGGLITIGFTDAVPEFDAIKAGTAVAAELSSNSAALVLWAYAFGSRPGDSIRLRITGPAGQVITSTTRLDREQAQLFRAAGKRTPPGGWPPGPYDGVAQMLRGSTVLDEQAVSITVR